MIVYFDLDGTLLNSGECSVITAQDTFRKYVGVELEAEKIIEKMGIPIEVSFRELSNGKINDDNWDEAAGYFRAKYKENSDQYTSLYDGVNGFLKRLKEQTDDIFIVTSKKTEAAENNLKKLGVYDLFNAVIGSDKVEKYKPDPDPIYQARKHLWNASQPEIMIGDADTDIIMGKAAGIKTCAVTWGAHDLNRLQKSSPDFIANDLQELEKAIATLK